MRTSEKLRSWRRRRGLNQCEAAIAAKIPQGSWSMIERGLRRPSKAQAFQLEKLTGRHIRASEWLTAAEAAIVERVQPVTVRTGTDG